MKKDNNLSLVIIYAILIIVGIITAFPIIYTFASSFKTNAEIFAYPERVFPKAFTFDNYILAAKSSDFNVLKMFWNSFYYSAFYVVTVVGASAMQGYAFARSEFPGKKIIFAIFSSMMFISMGSITIYPQFAILSHLGLSKSIWGLIFMNAFAAPIVNVYLIRGFIRSIPQSVDEAAKIDGCSFFGVFLRIILPIIKPVLATVTIFAFQGSWNDYLMPTLFTLSRPEQRTLIVGIMALKTSGNAASSWNLMLAASTVALIPVLIVYCICNRQFVSGLMAGAVKG